MTFTYMNSETSMPKNGFRARRRRSAYCVAAGLLTLMVAVPARGTTDATTTISVDTAQAGNRLPADFVGLSYEMRELSASCTTLDCIGNFDGRSGNLAALFKTLGVSNLRISGNQLDRDTLWVPNDQPVPNPLPDWVKDVVRPADIQRLAGFLQRTGWQAEVGINLAHYDPALAADEARTLYSTLGRQLTGAECGNEPDHYASNGYRPAPYGFEQHRADWEACADVVGNSRIAAPDISSPKSTADWFSQFAQAEQHRIDMLTIHNYTGATTVDQLLSPQIRDSELSTVAPQLAAAQAVHVPIRLDETNSAVGGGIDGVSNVYASALWAMDYNLVMAQAGFAGLNFHGGLSVCNAPLFNGKFQRYTPICAANEADRLARVYTVEPEFYGLYMATRMGPGRFVPVSVTSDHNVTAYAVRGDDGRLRVAVIEKDATSGPAVPVSISVGHGNGDARVLRLTGQTLDSAAGVAIQGSTVDRAGHLDPGRTDRVPVRHGAIRLDVAAGSAAIITLD
ncbi:MAG TPA: glycosyl hydrolase family 79 C-terminal domain-containing protein [Jatrophihabitantaceae bacterium]|jgi:hypothetical protein